MEQAQAQGTDRDGPGRPALADEVEQFSFVLPKAMLQEIRDKATAEGNRPASVMRRRLALGLKAELEGAK